MMDTKDKVWADETTWHICCACLNVYDDEAAKIPLQHFTRSAHQHNVPSLEGQWYALMHSACSPWYDTVLTLPQDPRNLCSHSGTLSVTSYQHPRNACRSINGDYPIPRNA